jgi:hypothetical protein
MVVKPTYIVYPATSPAINFCLPFSSKKPKNFPKNVQNQDIILLKNGFYLGQFPDEKMTFCLGDFRKLLRR